MLCKGRLNNEKRGEQAEKIVFFFLKNTPLGCVEMWIWAVASSRQKLLQNLQTRSIIFFTALQNKSIQTNNTSCVGFLYLKNCFCQFKTFGSVNVRAKNVLKIQICSFVVIFSQFKYVAHIKMIIS